MNSHARYLWLADVGLILSAAALSFALRFETLSLGVWRPALLLFALTSAGLRPVLLYAFGAYRRVWRYASMHELLGIAAAIALGSLLLALFLGIALPLRWLAAFPRSVILIEGMLSLLLVGGVRLALRIRDEPRIQGGLSAGRARRVLVVGAGSAGAMIVREMQTAPGLNLAPVGFVDDDVTKLGMCIHNLPILGTRHDIPALVARRRIDEVVIAIPSAPGKAIQEIGSICRQCGVAFRTIPGLYEIIDGRVRVSQLREVRLEDLLRREPVNTDLKEVGQFLESATVLVTGAGGSIGSELCRQIMRFQPRRLVLFELSEHNLYEIQRELAARVPSLDIVPIVGDVRKGDKVDWVFAQQRPEVVLHAAAYKHVPLMESNVDEVVANNVLGTRNLLDACQRYGSTRFALVSTDKAVNPRSVMGASKRIAELLVQGAARRASKAFVIVRFGNVLGSSGSVVPLFKEQIAGGGPVTVTHPEAGRYFMTIPEAASLIIQAAAMGTGGEIFVLDMGQPIRIQDLAGDLIRLSGLEPGRDIEIVFTSLRPGEKLHEALFMASEQCEPTRNPRIWLARSVVRADDTLERDLPDLEDALAAHDIKRIRAQLMRLVPEYQPGAPWPSAPTRPDEPERAVEGGDGTD